MAAPNTIILRGTRAAQPSAASVARGSLYYVTDESTTEYNFNGAWVTYADGGAGTGDVSASGTLTANRVIIGGGTTVVSALGSLGTTTTLLHGNAAGAPTFGTVVEADQTLADNTTNNVTSTKHGYTPKSPANAAMFLNGAATPAFALVTDANLSISDVTTNNATALAHGFAPKLSGTATTYLDGTGNFTTPAGSGTGDVNASGTLTTNRLIVGQGGTTVAALGTLGLSTQVLHGNAGGAPTFGSVVETDFSFSDVTTANVLSTRHGLAPKSPADPTMFLNGAATPAFALVKDSDLSVSDITTNDVTAGAHGFAPKLSGNALTFLNGAGTYTVPAGSGTGSVTNTGTLTDHGVIVGNGGVDVSAITVGTTNTVLHGVTGADPSFSAVVEADFSFTDNLTANVSASAHGLAPKLSGNALTFLNGAGSYSVPAGSGTGTVTNTGTLTDHALVVGNGGTDVSAVISLGTSTTVLHGAATGDPTWGAVVEVDMTLADNTTNNVLSTRHGFAPKSPANAAMFLNGAATPAFALVTDANLSLSDITTNNVTAGAHGFAPKLSGNALTFLNGAGAYTVPAGSGTGTVTNTGTLTNGGVIVGNGGADVSAIGLGTTTTLLHGNAAGDPSYGPVIENDMTLADNTTNNVSTLRHGFAPKSPNDATQYLDGTGVYSVPTTAGGTVINDGTLTTNRLVLGNGTTHIAVLGTLGTASTLLHGNALGAPTFGPVIETDITLADNVTNNVSTGRHGFTPKLSGSVTTFLNGNGGWTVPTATAGTYPPQNVINYGAMGNASYQTGGGNDDTAAIQAAYTAAGTTPNCPCVVFPSARVYRITSTINVPAGVYTVGLGGAAAGGEPAYVIWDGTLGGVMFQVATANANIISTLFDNITFAQASLLSNKPGTAVKFVGISGASARTDSGVGFRNVWIQGMVGKAIWFAQGGSTNFFIEGGRFDANQDYAIYVDLSGVKSFIGTIYGNTNWVGGGATQGKGFIHMDGEAATNPQGYSFLKIDGLHTEINQNLIQTFASGANPYDRCGIIRLGVTPANGNLQHMLQIDSWFNGAASGKSSYSAIQITSASGTTAAASDCVAVELTNLSGLINGTNDAGATDEARLIGGMVPASRRFPYASYRTSHVVWGFGKDAAGDGARSFWHQRHGSAAFRGLTILPETVADLDPFPTMAGALGYVTNATATTLGTVPVGGGSNKVMCMYNGSQWKIIANVN